MARLFQLFLVVMLLPTACRISEERPEIEVGMSRAEVLQLLGPPTESEVVVKQNEFIWGPQEAWWDQVEMGATLEVWSYLFPGEGTRSVYFLNESDRVSFKAFTPEGVVY